MRKSYRVVPAGDPKEPEAREKPMATCTHINQPLKIGQPYLCGRSALYQLPQGSRNLPTLHWAHTCHEHVAEVSGGDFSGFKMTDKPPTEYRWLG